MKAGPERGLKPKVAEPLVLQVAAVALALKGAERPAFKVAAVLRASKVVHRAAPVSKVAEVPVWKARLPEFKPAVQAVPASMPAREPLALTLTFAPRKSTAVPVPAPMVTQALASAVMQTFAAAARISAPVVTPTFALAPMRPAVEPTLAAVLPATLRQPSIMSFAATPKAEHARQRKSTAERARRLTLWITPAKRAGKRSVAFPPRIRGAAPTWTRMLALG